MISRYWPLFGLRMTIGELTLRALTEDDLPTLADLLPADVEQDPAATRYDVDADANRALVVHQGYWKAWGTWSPMDWALTFAVIRDGALIGTQTLEGTDFVVLRTVDSASFLAAPERGHGHGKQMRRAVLALAFGPLGAEAAITSAWHDNHASLGVSRALGYRSNGVSLHARGNARDEMVHLRLRRADWLDSDQAAEVSIHGFAPCRALFGLPPATDAC